MNTIIKLITLFICGILFSNCIHNNNMRYDPSQLQFLKQMKLMYEKNIVDFFPSDYNNPSYESKWGSYHYSPQDNSGGSCFRGLAYFSKEVSSSLLDSLELVNYIEKINHTDKKAFNELFIINYDNASAKNIDIRKPCYMIDINADDNYFYMLNQNTNESGKETYLDIYSWKGEAVKRIKLGGLYLQGVLFENKMYLKKYEDDDNIYLLELDL